jgi:hypothetical protein
MADLRTVGPLDRVELGGFACELEQAEMTSAHTTRLESTAARIIIPHVQTTEVNHLRHCTATSNPLIGYERMGLGDLRGVGE